MSTPSPFVSPVDPAVDPQLLAQLNLVLDLVAAASSKPEYRDLPWPAVVAAYRDALRAMLDQWIEESEPGAAA